MVLSLPNNESATLRTASEVTERASRRIRAARRGTAEQAAALLEAGFDENVPSTWGALKTIGDESAIERYQDCIVVEMVKSWTLGDLPTLETVGDLPRPTYVALVIAADQALAETDDFTADGALDPKAPTGESSDSEPTSPVVVSNQLTPTPTTTGESSPTAP